ncbi:MAG: HlyD family efflux transporter periplasmic adaptor subunit [Pirellulaceae bacterium]
MVNPTSNERPNEHDEDRVQRSSENNASPSGTPQTSSDAAWQTQEDIAKARLRHLRTSLRSDLQITRQVTKGEPVYVLYDPVKFQAHRLSLLDYEVASRIRSDQTLASCFQACMKDGVLGPESEVNFFDFVTRLDSLSVLSTSQQDADVLYQRFQTRVAGEKKAKWTGFLFLTIPLANPDRFLDRSIRHVSFLFSKQILLMVAGLMLAAGVIILSRWEEFIQPLNSILALNNLLFMSVAFLALKVWHELGHGYVCKHFGGRVPEMGCKLIAGMPLAYMDATSAYSFPKRAHRIAVMLGGMYFEVLVAIPATFLWAFLPDTFLGSCAYQLIFMAGVATVFFNANPLMKYDGYFILSDVLGIPNLRSKASNELNGLFKRRVLGIASDEHRSPNWPILLSYGIASSLYGLSLIVSISVMIALRFHVLGLILSAIQLGSMGYRSIKKFFSYLLASPETEPVRGRSRAVAYVLGAGIPALLLLFPIPTGLRVPGVVSSEETSIVRAETAGILTSIQGELGASVRAGQALVRIRNVDSETDRRSENIRAAAAKRGAMLVSRHDVQAVAKQRFEAIQALRRQKQAVVTAGKCCVLAPQNGRLVQVVPDHQIGKFIQVGDPVARVVSGNATVRAFVSESQLASAKLQVGSQVRVQFSDNTVWSSTGVIESVSAARTERFEDLAVTTAGSGSIALDPETGETKTPVFLVLIQVDDLDGRETLQEQRASVLIGRRFETGASWLLRRTRNFVNSIFAT